MELTKADVTRLRNDILDCTRYIQEYLDDEAGCFPYFFPCFQDIGKKATKVNDYIVNTNDEALACTLAKIDRAVWHRIQGVWDYLETDEGKLWHREFATAAKELFEIHNWYLENIYHIPVEAVRDCKYFVHSVTGEVMDADTKQVLPKPQHQAPEVNNNRNEQESPETAPESPLMLPDELHTDEAVKTFEKAVTAGLMERQGNGYKWNKSNALLAYMCGRLYCGDCIEIDKYTGQPKYKRDKTEFFPEKALCTLFGVKNLGQTRRQVADQQNPPTGYKDIDRLF